MALTQDEFQFVANLVYRESGIVIDPSKSYLVESRLSQLARSQNLASHNEVIEKMRGTLAKFWTKKAVEAMTTNETYWFRDPFFYDALRNTVFPELIQRRAQTKTLNIWCAACSTGQEPYSIKMLLRENFPVLRDWRVRFLATDINEAVLQIARGGTYNQLEINRGLPTAMRDRYFRREGDHWVVVPELREDLEFRQFNLQDAYSGFANFDLILLRNVLIYFDADTRRAVAEKMSKVLKPDGLLCLCTSEGLSNVTSVLKRVAALRTSMYANVDHHANWESRCVKS